MHISILIKIFYFPSSLTPPNNIFFTVSSISNKNTNEISMGFFGGNSEKVYDSHHVLVESSYLVIF